MLHQRYGAVVVVGALLLSPVGCGGTTNEPAATTEIGGDTAAADGPVALTTADLDALERGLRAEIAAVREAQQKSSAAKTPQERGEAIQATFEDATIPQGAAAAGLPLPQYRAVRETVTGIFQTLDFQGKIDGPLSMDVSRADAAMKERLARDPFADLPQDSAAALRAHMDRLVPVWIDYVTLTAVAG